MQIVSDGDNLHEMSNQKIGDNLHEMSNPFFWENKKNIITLLSAELTDSMLSVKS